MKRCITHEKALDALTASQADANHAAFGSTQHCPSPGVLCPGHRGAAAPTFPLSAAPHSSCLLPHAWLCLCDSAPPGPGEDAAGRTCTLRHQELCLDPWCCPTAPSLGSREEQGQSGHSKAHLIPAILQQDPCPWMYQPSRTAGRHSKIRGLKLWLIYAPSLLFLPLFFSQKLKC